MPTQQLILQRLSGLCPDYGRLWCAVKALVHSGGIHTRPGTGSLHPVAIRAAVEATRLLKPLVQRVAKATRRACRL